MGKCVAGEKGKGMTRRHEREKEENDRVKKGKYRDEEGGEGKKITCSYE